MTATNYFKVMHAGKTTASDIFPFDGTSLDAATAALTAARRLKGPSGRVVAFKQPRYIDFEGGLVGEPSSVRAGAAEPSWLRTANGNPSRFDGGLS